MTESGIEEPPENVVKRWYGLVGSGNWDGMRELMTEDFKNHYPPSFQPEPMGREELIAFFKHFGWWLQIHDIFSSGDRVAVRVTITNKIVKEFEGIPPSEKERTVEGNVIWRVEDGEVAEAWAFLDSYGLLEELGLTFPRILVTVPRIFVRKLLP